MTDIVERLQQQAMTRMFRSEELSDGTMIWFPIMREAADEIERLRDSCDKSYNEGLEVGKNAREALRVENERLRLELNEQILSAAQLRELIKQYSEETARLRAARKALGDTE